METREKWVVHPSYLRDITVLTKHVKVGKDKDYVENTMEIPVEFAWKKKRILSPNEVILNFPFLFEPRDIVHWKANPFTAKPYKNGWYDESGLRLNWHMYFNPERFRKFAMPLMQSVYPNLLAQNLVSVQPMSSPTTKIFYETFFKDTEDENPGY